MLDKTSLTYTRLFCEENIWQLASVLQQQAHAGNGFIPLDVLFLINPTKTVAIYQQNAAPHNEATQGQPVIWDYHVILTARSVSTQELLQQPPVEAKPGQSLSETWILDFDSRLPFPVNIHDYFDATFAPSHLLPESLRPLIRAIPAMDYLMQFDSDRNHMQGCIPQSEFPDYPAIRSNAATPLHLTDLFDTRTIASNALYTPEEYLQYIRNR